MNAHQRRIAFRRFVRKFGYQRAEQREEQRLREAVKTVAEFPMEVNRMMGEHFRAVIGEVKS